MTQAVPVVNYMREVYTNSSGEIHCLSEQDFEFYKDFIDNGGQPALSLTHPENTNDSI